MANKKTDMSKLRQMLRLYAQGESKLKISDLTGVSRNTLKKYLKIYVRLGLSLPDIDKRSDLELDQLFGESLLPEPSDRYKALEPSFPTMEKELKKRGMTRHILWERYIALNPDGYKASQFKYHYQQWLRRSKPVMHIEHIAGDKMSFFYKLIYTNLLEELRVVFMAGKIEDTFLNNKYYSPCEAVHFLEELEKNGIRPVLFEQPVIKSDLQGMRFVKDHTSIPIAADESVFTSADAINVVRTGCADIINIKLMKSGIIEALDIIAIARSANIKLMIGCMLESKLALGCSAHMAAGTGAFDYIDLDPHIDPEREPFTEGPDYSAPFYTLS